MTRKRFQKLSRALLVKLRMDTKETGLMRSLYADKLMPDEGLSYAEEWEEVCVTVEIWKAFKPINEVLR